MNRIDYKKAKELSDEGNSVMEISKIMNVKFTSLAPGMRKRFGKVIKGNKEKLLSEQQKELIFGSLLGDGYLNFKYKDNTIKGNIRFCEEHGSKQEVYLKYKGKLLEDHLANTGISSRNRINEIFKNPKFINHVLRTKANPAYNEFYKLFYIERKKIIPKDLSLLTPYAIAFWFMDDGTKSPCGYKLCTNCFELEDIERICFYLKDMYNIYTSINKKKEIYIKAKSLKEFTELIKKYIIKSMEYKLHNI